MKRLIRNNKGFSLLELLIVIALLAIMTGFATLGLAMVNNMNVNKAARELNSAINKAHSQSISKGTEAGKLYLYNNGGNIYYNIGVDDLSTATLLCNSQVTCTYVTYNDSNSYKPEASAAILPTSSSISFAPSGVCVDDTNKICQVIFTRNNRKVAVVLYRQTGKHEVKLY